VGGTAADNRLFVEAVLFRFRAGIPWRDLPERFGNWKIVHQRFLRWAKSGVFERVFRLLASDQDNEYMMIEATIVRAHQHSTGTQKKTVRKPSVGPAADLTTKIHALVDALGNPVEVMLTPGQDHDLTCAEPLIEAVDPGALIADKAFDADAFIGALNARGITPVIPPKSSRKTPGPCDFALYCERNLTLLRAPGAAIETASPWRQSKVRLGHPIKLNFGFKTPRGKRPPCRPLEHSTPFHQSRCAQRMTTQLNTGPS
jgi:transposase